MSTSFMHAFRRYGEMMGLKPVVELWLNEGRFRVYYNEVVIVGHGTTTSAFGMDKRREVAAEAYLREIAGQTVQIGYQAGSKRISVPGLALLTDVGPGYTTNSLLMDWNVKDEPPCDNCYHSHRQTVRVTIGLGGENIKFNLCEECLVFVMSNAVLALESPVIRIPVGGQVGA